MSELGPFIVSRPTLESGGVDFLGLRQTNLDLMAEAIPGINNTTDRIRPFSLMSWITWKFKSLSAGMSRSEVNASYIEFRERIEILYSWSHWIHGKRDLPGLGSVHPPIGVDGNAPLTFEAWKRIPTSTSYFAAIQYGPASKSISGLGFLESVGPNHPLQPTTLGKKLASAMDESLRSYPAYERLLNNLGVQQASEIDVRELYQFWALDLPTHGERETFRVALYSPDSRDPLQLRRSEIASRIRSLISKRRPLTIHKLRSLICADPAEGDDVSSRWVALQLRQAQRLGMETMFHFLEYDVVVFERNRKDTILSFEDAIKTGSVGPINPKTIFDWLRWCETRFPNSDALLTEIATEGNESPLVISEKIHKLIGSKHSVDKRLAVALAFHLLIIIAHGLSLLSASFSPRLKQLARWGADTGARDRLSLEVWAELIARESQSDLALFLDKFVFGELLSRHVFTASRRADGSSNRLRIAYDGDRWTKFVSTPAPVPFTPDRLVALVKLMKDCHLIEVSDIQT